MRLSIGNGGWVRADDVAGLPGPLYVRLRPRGDGRWQVTEVYLDGDGEALTSEALGRVPLADLEAVINNAGRESLQERAGLPAVLLSEAASYYATTFGPRAQGWPVDMLRSQFDSGTRLPAAGNGVSVVAPDAAPLSPPARGRITDEFLHEVSRAYGAAVQRGQRPAVALAEQAGVSARTVHGWIYQARKRGIMPPGTQGRVS